MATAAPHVKLLRQLASAKDDYLSGAFDISWDGAKATLYLVFGRPSHAVFETDQAQIEGEAAIDALLAALPRVFAVSDWRRAMSPHETLSITIDELAGPFVRLAGSYADDPVTDESPEWWSAEDDSPDLPFGLTDFPLLPGGRPLWIEASPDEVHLADRLAELPPSILILTGAKLRAAAVVSGGDLIDAVWIDADDHARGETAGMALLGATKGSLAGYALDDPRVAEALTMLWRLPLAVSGVELSWLDPASMLAAFRADGLDRVLVIDAPVRGIALFSRGGLVAVYSETQRSAVASPERLRSLLSQARGRLTVMERKPRPLAADAIPKPASARDHFEVAATEATAAGEAAPEEAIAGMAADEVVASLSYATLDAAPDADSSPTLAADDGAGGEQEATSDDAPPPPPPDADVSAAFADTPPPPAPVPDATQPERKKKRSRWGFGRSRRSRAERHVAEAAAADIEASIESADSEAATFAGWSVRQPGAAAPAVGYRSPDTAGTPPPPEDFDAGQGDDAAPTWSLAGPADDPPAAADVAAADSDDALGESPAPDEPATADSQPADEPDAHDAPRWVAPDSPAPSADVDGDPHTQSHPMEFVPLDEPTPEPAPQASGSWLAASWLDDVVSGEAPPASSESDATSGSDDVDHGHEQSAPDTEPVAAADDAADASTGEQDAGEPSHEDDSVEAAADLDPSGELPRPTSAVRTPGPWTWPLAEPDEEPRDAAAATPASFPIFHDEPEAPELQTAAVAAGHEESTAALDQDAEAGFFHRDEPVGSQYVDFDEVRNELVQIGIVWLGETNAVQVTALLSNTRSTIDDFVATIDVIRGLHIEGQDPASIQAMAREMHQQAAERLCGA